MRKRQTTPYRSKFEAKVAARLYSLGVKFGYETEELEYSSTVRGGVCKDCGSRSVLKKRIYTPDFIITTKKGKVKVYVEAKGRFTSQDRSKMLDVLKAHPGITLVMLFQRDNKIDAKRKYSDWCIKNKINYCIGEVESKWLF